jgi:hypothetical protein
MVWSATDKVFGWHEGKISRNRDFYDLSTITR